jgi:hypothetical protein
VCRAVDGAARAGLCTVDHVGKVIPFERAEHKARVIRLAPIRARRGSLEKMIGPKGVRALRWFARPVTVMKPQAPRTTG